MKSAVAPRHLRCSDNTSVHQEIHFLQNQGAFLVSFQTTYSCYGFILRFLCMLCAEKQPSRSPVSSFQTADASQIRGRRTNYHKSFPQQPSYTDHVVMLNEGGHLFIFNGFYNCFLHILFQKATHFFKLFA